MMQPNKLIDIFENQLNTIEHYQRFPAMKPFIGLNYGQRNSLKIMLIGESHYLPKGSTISYDSKRWYNSTQSDLTIEEIEWINTRKILNGDWKPKGHMIFRQLNNQLSNFTNKSEFRAMESIAFMNGFQRPSPETGKSMKYFCKSIDYKIGADMVHNVINIIQPNLVIFVSKFSWEKLGLNLPKSELKLDYDFVCHPGTGGRYWHNTKYPHGAKKFNAILKDKLKASK